MRTIEGRCYVCNREMTNKEDETCSELCASIWGLVKYATRKRLIEEGAELDIEAEDPGKGKQMYP